MSKGLFVAFEGIDGCGKSTQLSLAADKLRNMNKSVVVTREPGGTPISEKIREILIDPKNDSMTDECELLLYLASRAQHVNQTVLPELAQGHIVLCDRFQEATFAYQGFGRGISLDVLKQLNSYATSSLVPDRTYIFDIPVEVSVQRLRALGKGVDRLEKSPKEFFLKIREGYKKLAKSDPDRIVLIDGTEHSSDIASKVHADLMLLINR